MADDAAQNGPDAPGPGDQAPAGKPANGESPQAKPKAKTWRPWTIGVSALLALVSSLVLLVGDLLAGVLSNLGGPAPIATFVRIAVLGHVALALASAFLFGVGLANAARRRPAVFASWAIIPVGIGWFFLWGRLAAA